MLEQLQILIVKKQTTIVLLLNGFIRISTKNGAKPRFLFSNKLVIIKQYLQNSSRGHSSVSSGKNFYMPTKRPSLINNEIYHIVIRGVADSLIFQDESDYYRGIFSIYEFNNTKPVVIRERRKERIKEKQSIRGMSSDTRDLLVEILAFAFMPNHIHLLLKQLKDNGISEFMRKVGTGYASYFNKKYDRAGHLFQARFGAVHIQTDEQFKNVFVYIHTNPTSLVEPDWKEKGIKDPQKTIDFLENYRWSSHLDYIGKKNFPSVTNRELLSKILEREKGCREFVENWIFYKAEIQNLGPVVLE